MTLISRSDALAGQQGQGKALAEFQCLHALESCHPAGAGILPESREVTPLQIGDTTQP